MSILMRHDDYSLEREVRQYHDERNPIQSRLELPAFRNIGEDERTLFSAKGLRAELLPMSRLTDVFFGDVRPFRLARALEY